MQEKAIAFPTDARSMHRARASGWCAVTLPVRQIRTDEAPALRHAKQFKRANKALRRIRTMLGRLIRDVQRKIANGPELAEVFALPLSLAQPSGHFHWPIALAILRRRLMETVGLTAAFLVAMISYGIWQNWLLCVL